jgi:hypothetical protein
MIPLTSQSMPASLSGSITNSLVNSLSNSMPNSMNNQSRLISFNNSNNGTFKLPKINNNNTSTIDSNSKIKVKFNRLTSENDNNNLQTHLNNKNKSLIVKPILKSNFDNNRRNSFKNFAKRAAGLNSLSIAFKCNFNFPNFLFIFPVLKYLLIIDKGKKSDIHENDSDDEDDNDTGHIYSSSTKVSISSLLNPNSQMPSINPKCSNDFYKIVNDMEQEKFIY